VEAYFQAQKESDSIKRNAFASISDPETAFAQGNQVHMSVVDIKAWEKRKKDVMKEAIEAKFTQHASLQTLLLSTYPHTLRQIKPTDSYWGTGPDGKGQNMLGVLLMELRDRLYSKKTIDSIYSQ
jgi:ribA/ribD-fused uncharacterized protein